MESFLIFFVGHEDNSDCWVWVLIYILDPYGNLILQWLYFFLFDWEYCVELSEVLLIALTIILSKVCFDLVAILLDIFGCFLKEVWFVGAYSIPPSLIDENLYIFYCVLELEVWFHL